MPVKIPVNVWVVNVFAEHDRESDDNPKPSSNSKEYYASQRGYHRKERVYSTQIGSL